MSLTTNLIPDDGSSGGSPYTEVVYADEAARDLDTAQEAGTLAVINGQAVSVWNGTAWVDYNASATSTSTVWKPAVDTFAELPTTDLNEGDRIEVLDDTDTAKNGVYRWSGTAWIKNELGTPTYTQKNFRTDPLTPNENILLDDGTKVSTRAFLQTGIDSIAVQNSQFWDSSANADNTAAVLDAVREARQQRRTLKVYGDIKCGHFPLVSGVPMHVDGSLLIRPLGERILLPTNHPSYVAHQTGTADITNGSRQITNVSAALKVGNYIRFDGIREHFTVNAYDSGTQTATINKDMPYPTATGLAYKTYTPHFIVQNEIYNVDIDPTSVASYKGYRKTQIDFLKVFAAESPLQHVGGFGFMAVDRNGERIDGLRNNSDSGTISEVLFGEIEVSHFDLPMVCKGSVSNANSVNPFQFIKGDRIVTDINEESSNYNLTLEGQANQVDFTDVKLGTIADTVVDADNYRNRGAALYIGQEHSVVGINTNDKVPQGGRIGRLSAQAADWMVEIQGCRMFNIDSVYSEYNINGIYAKGQNFQTRANVRIGEIMLGTSRPGQSNTVLIAALADNDSDIIVERDHWLGQMATNAYQQIGTGTITPPRSRTDSRYDNHGANHTGDTMKIVTAAGGVPEGNYDGATRTALRVLAKDDGSMFYSSSSTVINAILATLTPGQRVMGKCTRTQTFSNIHQLKLPFGSSELVLEDGHIFYLERVQLDAETNYRYRILLDPNEKRTVNFAGGVLLQRYVGALVKLFIPGDRTVTLPNSAPRGWNCDIWTNQTGTTTFAAETGGALNIAGLTAPYTMPIHGKVKVECVENNTGVNATWKITGDVTGA